MDDQLRSRLQKLKNLAERGVGGEKDTAEKKFQKLLDENNLTEADLNEDEVNFYAFSYKYPYRYKLFCQIVYKVVGRSGNYAVYRVEHTRNKAGVYCTAAQKVEIELDFEFYSQLLDEEIEVLVSAFIAKQSLYPEDVIIDRRPFSEWTEEEKEAYLKKTSYMQNIDKRTRSKMIEDTQGET